MNLNAKEIFELLIYNYYDKEIFKECISELRKRNVTFDLNISDSIFCECLNYAELMNAFANAIKWNREKISAVKTTDFENAASFRDREKDEMEKIEKLGYGISYFLEEKFIFRVDFIRETSTFIIEVQTGNKKLIRFMKKVQKMLKD